MCVHTAVRPPRGRARDGSVDVRYRARTATMALKRLRGLIADCPELLAGVAPLIAAAGELS
ncbi:hypothetical protein GCM10020256_31840 [Streptomyces thermocoprophilus]